MRIAVTILAIVIAAAFVAAMFFMPKSEPAAPTPAPVASSPVESATPEQPAKTTATTMPPTAETPTPSVPLGSLHIIVPESQPKAGIRIGSTSAGEYLLEADLSAFGPAITQVRLSLYHEQPQGNKPYEIFDTVKPYPLAARSIKINTQSFDLLRPQEGFPKLVYWELIHHDSSKVTYRLRFANGADRVVLEVIREFELHPNSYDIIIRQRFINHADQSLEVTWSQFAQGDVRPDTAAIMGDQRSVIVGFLNLKDAYIYTTDPNRRHATVLDNHQKGKPFWPDPDVEGDPRLMWFASANRYFALAAHPLPDDTKLAGIQLAQWALDQSFADLKLYVPPAEQPKDQHKMLFALTSKPFTLAPSQERALDLGLFAGPRKNDIFEQPLFKRLNFDQLVVYNLGGACAFCTFQWLAHLLMGFLRFLHNYLVFDWGLAIIVLVCVVRLILHPITKKSQMNMMKMGKQMQIIQPEIEKLKKKYGEDQQKMSTEMWKLYKEKGFNPASAGLMGCLPMVLQMPIWFALYAMLYYAIELRHEPAFFDVFHKLGDLVHINWSFLSDLSSPDHFITFFPEPRYWSFWYFSFNYSAINILPLLMGVVFFLQQKLTMTTAATDEQRRQQRMMMIMTTVLFPIMMYSVPSGLTLYIMTSTAIGIVESYIVRKHIKEQEALGTLFVKKPGPKPGGLFDRMQKMMEEKQKQIMQNREQGGKKDGNGDNKGNKRRPR